MALNSVSNHAANVAQRHLARTNAGLALSLAKLSAGTRVLSARDDAAALAIGSRLNAEAVGLRQAAVNTSQASSMLQVADGANSQINDILVRMKSLAIQAGSDTLSATERSMLNTEFQALGSEVNRIAADTEFAGTPLVDSTQSFTFKVGTGASPSADEITVTIDGISASALGIDGAAITDAASADAASAAITAAIDTVQISRANIGASQNRLESAFSSITTAADNVEAARSRLLDLDVAAEMSRFTSQKVLLQAGIAMLAQANQTPKAVQRLFR